MIEQLISDIIEAENKGDNIIRDGAVKAKEIVLNANKAISDIEKKTQEEIKNLDNKNKAEAEKEAEAKSKIIINAGMETAEGIKKLAEKNKQEAIDVIVGRMKKKYANS